MNIIVVGLNHRTAPVALRERFALSDEESAKALYHLKEQPVIQEALILSTCNRVEIYAVVAETDAGYRLLQNFFLDQESPSQRESLASALYLYGNRDGLRHLFRVASGLDSMVLGEPQILGQIKDAFDWALQHKFTGTILNKVFKKAISVAKRVRTETKVAENAVSISFAAVQLAKKIFGKLHQKTVMLVGAGEMAELAARHFISNGASPILITNRNYERALELASEYRGLPVRFEDFVAEMYQSDVVLCSTGAPHYIIGPQEVSKVIAARQNRPIFFIDISVPRNIDPAINKLDNVFLYDMDDLKLFVEANIRLREAEALKAEAILTEEIEQIVRWYKSLDAVPLILALREKAEKIRQTEMTRALAKSSFTPAQQEAIEGLTLAMINKFLHGPLATLKEEALSPNGSMVLESARKLFFGPEKDSETGKTQTPLSPLNTDDLTEALLDPDATRSGAENKKE